MKKKEIEINTQFVELRDIIMDELRGLRNGTISEKRARVTSNLIKRAIELASLELFATNKLNIEGGNEFKALISGEAERQE